MRSLSLPYHLILGSQSPRRRQLLESIGLAYEVRTKNITEDFPDNLSALEVPLYLAQKKAHAMAPEISSHDLLITADTIVSLQEKVLNKPSSFEEAIFMLQQLSGREHQVVTGVCLLTQQKQVVFSDITQVLFAPLTNSEIEYYVQQYPPYDKAGAYGAQEWMGMIGIEKIEGSYFNVMGLPVHKLYQELKNNFSLSIH